MKRLLVVLLAMTLVLAACGGETSDPNEANTGDTQQPADNGDSGATESTDPPQSDDDGGGSGLPPSGTGTVTIDGETIEAEWVGNCLIDEMFNPHPDDLDLTAALGDGLNALFINISYEELTNGLLMRFSPDMQLQDDAGNYVSYETDGEYLLAPDGNWYYDDGSLGLYIILFTGQPHEFEPLPDAPVTINGNNIQGAMTLHAGDASSDVSFDLDIIEAVDCSL